MGRRQFHTGEESQGGNFGNKRRATEKRSPIDPFHIYVNEVELEDKTITRSDV